MASPPKKLRKTHYEQMLSYVNHIERGIYFYYGNKAQFDKRHDDIRAWLERMIRTFDE